MSLNLDSKSLLIGGAGAFAAMTLLGGDKKSTSLSGLAGTKSKRKSASKPKAKKASTTKRKTTKRK